MSICAAEFPSLYVMCLWNGIIIIILRGSIVVVVDIIPPPAQLAVAH